MIVIDASAAVLGLMNDGDARAMLAAQAATCPHLADSEVVHALRGRVLRGDLDVGAAERMIDVWQRLPLPVANTIGPFIGRQVG